MNKKHKIKTYEVPEMFLTTMDDTQHILDMCKINGDYDSCVSLLSRAKPYAQALNAVLTEVMYGQDQDLMNKIEEKLREIWEFKKDVNIKRDG